MDPGSHYEMGEQGQAFKNSTCVFVSNQAFLGFWGEGSIKKRWPHTFSRSGFCCFVHKAYFANHGRDGIKGHSASDLGGAPRFWDGERERECLTTEIEIP